MVHKLVSTLALVLVVYANPEDKNWVWGDNNRENGRNAGLREEASARYEIYENDDLNSYPGTGNGFGVGPGAGQFPGSILNKPGNIPGGIYNGNNQLYGEGHGQYYPNDRPGPGILSGPSSSFQGEGPYKEFDRCKCTERFNCNSPGISYGHCDVGKRYCCYSTTKKGQAGGPLPSRPVHSIENGILVGPGGPVGGNNFQRPVGGGFGEHGRPVGGFGEHDRPVNGFGGSDRPGGFGQQVRPGGFGGPFRPGGGGFGGRPGSGGFGGRPGSGGFGLGGQNLYSPNQGILVGPGGPSNRPNFGYNPGFARSAIDKKD